MAATKSKRFDIHREHKSRVLESAPPPRTGEPGEFAADCRRIRKIMAENREYPADLVARRKAVAE